MPLLEAAAAVLIACTPQALLLLCVLLLISVVNMSCNPLRVRLLMVMVRCCCVSTLREGRQLGLRGFGKNDVPYSVEVESLHGFMRFLPNPSVTRRST